MLKHVVVGSRFGVISRLPQIIPRPCVMIAAMLPKGKWWVLDRAGEFGWLEGDLVANDVCGLNPLPSTHDSRRGSVPIFCD